MKGDSLFCLNLFEKVQLRSWLWHLGDWSTTASIAQHDEHYPAMFHFVGTSAPLSRAARLPNKRKRSNYSDLGEIS